MIMKCIHEEEDNRWLKWMKWMKILLAGTKDREASNAKEGGDNIACDVL